VCVCVCVVHLYRVLTSSEFLLSAGNKDKLREKNYNCNLKKKGAGNNGKVLKCVDQWDLASHEWMVFFFRALVLKKNKIIKCVDQWDLAFHEWIVFFFWALVLKNSQVRRPVGPCLP
jgi:hypothetical protein